MLNVYYYGYGGSSGSWINRTVYTYRLTRYWLESQATVTKATSTVNWTRQWAEGDYTAQGGGYTFTFGTYGWKSFNIKTMVETWLATPSTNYGVLLNATNETTDGCDVRLRSSEYTDVSYRPYLEVNYTRPIAKKYYLKDHLGNIRVTIDANGVVKAYDDYYPFGLQMPGRTYNNGLNNPIYKYSSKELDEENDLDWYYFGARYYDPGIGRFNTVDPHSDLYTSLNPYHYVGNNPLSFIDPTGMDSIDIQGHGVEMDPNLKLAVNIGEKVGEAVDYTVKKADNMTAASFTVAVAGIGISIMGAAIGQPGIIEAGGMITEYALTSGTIATGVSLGGKAIEYAANDGSPEAVREQSAKFLLSASSGLLAVKEIAAVSRTEWPTGAMFRSNVTGRAVDNLSGALSTAATDATRIVYENILTFTNLILNK